MNAQENIHTVLRTATFATIIVIGIILEFIGISMLYKATMVAIGRVSFSAGLVLLIMGLILIVVALPNLSSPLYANPTG